jgi:hypothetical protein
LRRITLGCSIQMQTMCRWAACAAKTACSSCSVNLSVCIVCKEYSVIHEIIWVLLCHMITAPEIHLAWWDNWHQV